MCSLAWVPKFCRILHSSLFLCEDGGVGLLLIHALLLLQTNDKCLMRVFNMNVNVAVGICVAYTYI